MSQDKAIDGPEIVPPIHGWKTSRFVSAAGVTVLATSVFAAWLGLRLGGTRCVLIVDDTGTALAALVAAATCVHAAIRHRGRLRLTWWLLAAACACWTLAEIIWAVYNVLLRQAVPVPSWADFGYLTAIPLAVVALWCHPAMHSHTKSKLRSLFDSLVIATALMFTTWTLVLGPLWRSTDLSTVGGLVTLAYPFGDVIIIFFVLLVIRRMRGGDRLALFCLLGGLLAMALSDSTYTYLIETNAYATGNLIDAGWVAAYLAIALAAFLSRRGSAVLAPTSFSTVPTLTSFLTPFVPALLALGVAGVELTVGHHLDLASTLMAIGLVILVLARQSLLAVELAASGQSTDAKMLQHLLRIALGPRSPRPQTQRNRRLPGAQA